MKPKTTFILSAFVAASVSSTSAATLLSISHDGTSGDEASPFDTKVLSQGTDWSYTTDAGRSVMTAVDSVANTSGNNRLILVETDGISQFTTTGTAADKGWVFELEIKFLTGVSQDSVRGSFANFGVRSENDAGKQVWVGLNEKSQKIGWVNVVMINMVVLPSMSPPSSAMETTTIS